MHIVGINATINRRYVGEVEIRPNDEICVKLHPEVLEAFKEAFTKCLANGIELKLNYIPGIQKELGE